jgi:hypothetical protein
MSDHPKYASEWRGLATLSNEIGALESVRCKIFLPKYHRELPCIELFPEEKPSSLKFTEKSFSFFAAIEFDTAGNVMHVQSDVARIDSHVTRYWSDEAECRLTLAPESVVVRRSWTNDQSDSILGESELVIWISDNKLIRPQIFFTRSYDGTVTPERLSVVSIPLASGVTITFDQHFYHARENENYVQLPLTVAKATLPANYDSMLIESQLIPEIEELLTLVSFVSGTRTNVLGWEFSTSSDETQKYFCHRETTPESAEFTPNGLIDKNLTENFLRQSLSVFRQNVLKPEIEKAVFSLTPMKKLHLEADFFALFSAFEAIVSAFANQTLKTKVVSDKSLWARLRKSLENAIKQIPELDRDTRANLYEKLGELNRTPVRRLMETFLAEFDVWCNDLWPLFGDDQGLGLIDVRNHVIHGTNFLPGTEDALLFARGSLQWLLARSLLRILEWDLEQTNLYRLPPDFPYYPVANMMQHRMMLAKLLIRH